MIDQAQALDANLAICAGIRWLFQKRKLASHQLKRQANWEETILCYKDYLIDVVSGKNKNSKGMNTFKENIEALSKK